MKRFSKGRLVLFTILLSAVVLAMAAPTTAWGQDSGGGERKPAKINPFQLVMNNIDPVFVVITLCSIIGVTLIIQGFIKNRRVVMMPEASVNQIREMIAQRQFKELIEFTETEPSFISRALNPALKRAPSFSAMKEAMETAVGEQTAESFRKIEYLNIIGNLGPLLGLLGTVLGMIDAFGQMSAAKGAADPAVLAGGISQALCHTMLGLVLAIPCLSAFGVLRTMVDRLTVQAALLAEELLLAIKPAEAKPAAAPMRHAAVAAPAIRKAPIPAPPVVPA